MALQIGPVQAAENYPSKTITLVSHTSPGGGTDLFLRALAPFIQKRLNTPVVVENRPGGSSAVAMQYVKSMPPDGYTMICSTDSLLITPLKNKLPASTHDFRPVSRLLIEGNVLYVRADSKWTAKSMLEAITKGTKNVNWGTTQAGSPETISTTTLIKKYKCKINPVAYGEGPKALLGVLGGDVEASAAELAEIQAQLQAKQLRVILSFNSERIPQLPDVPTFVESGFPDVFIDKFRGLHIHKDTSDEVVAILDRTVADIMKDPEYLKIAERNVQIPAYLNAKAFAEFMKKTEANYAVFFKAGK